MKDKDLQTRLFSLNLVLALNTACFILGSLNAAVLLAKGAYLPALAVGTLSLGNGLVAGSAKQMKNNLEGFNKE